MIWKKLKATLKNLFNPDFVVDADNQTKSKPDGFSGSVQPIGVKGKKTT